MQTKNWCTHWTSPYVFVCCVYIWAKDFELYWCIIYGYDGAKDMKIYGRIFCVFFSEFRFLCCLYFLNCVPFVTFLHQFWNITYKRKIYYNFGNFLCCNLFWCDVLCFSLFCSSSLRSGKIWVWNDTIAILVQKAKGPAQSTQINWATE